MKTPFPSGFDIVDGTVYCSGNRHLKSLDGAPETTTGSFFCSYNPKLKSLTGAPEHVGKNFICCSNVGLESLKGSPQTVDGDFICHDNPKLTRITGITAPSNIKGKFITDDPKLRAQWDKLVKYEKMFKDHPEEEEEFGDLLGRLL